MNAVVPPSRPAREVQATELQVLRKAELYRQANAIGRSAQGLELFEKRLIVLALAAIDHGSEKPSLEAVVPLRAFEEHGIENPYDRAKKAAEMLPSRVVMIPREDGGFEAYPWLQRLSYVPAEESDLGFSYIRVLFNEELRPWITDLKTHYAVLPLRDVLQMPSIFSARLYEVLWHLTMAGRRPEVEIGLMELKFAVGLVERDKKGGWVRERYKDWRDFRKQLQQATKAFDEHGSLSASFKGVRVGRRIGKVRFQVDVIKAIPHLGIQPALFDDSGNRGEERLQERLRKVGFTGSASRLIAEHTAPVVEAAVAITERKSREGALTNPGGFLRTLLQDGTARQESLKQEKQKAHDGQQVSSGGIDEDALLAAWERHRHDVADQVAAGEGLSDEQVRELIRRALRDDLAGKLVITTLERNNWSGPTFAMYRTSVLLEQYAEKVPTTAQDFEAFRVREDGVPSSSGTR